MDDNKLQSRPPEASLVASTPGLPEAAEPGIAHGVLLTRSKARVPTKAGELTEKQVKVAVDSCSTRTLAKRAFMKTRTNTRHKVAGVNGNEKTASGQGTVELLLEASNPEDKPRWLNLKAIETATIGPDSANIDVLVDAQTSHLLGYTRNPPSSTKLPPQQLPHLTRHRTPMALYTASGAPESTNCSSDVASDARIQPGRVVEIISTDSNTLLGRHGIVRSINKTRTGVVVLLDRTARFCRSRTVELAPDQVKLRDTGHKAVGRRITVVGLVQQVKYNGLNGVIKARVNNSRVRVKLEPTTDNDGEVINISIGNIIKREPERYIKAVPEPKKPTPTEQRKNPLYCHLFRDRPPYTSRTTSERSSAEVLADVFATFDIVDDDGLTETAADELVTEHGQWVDRDRSDCTLTEEFVLYSETKIAAVLDSVPMPLRGEVVNKYADIQYGKLHDDYDTPQQLHKIQQIVKQAWDKGIFCREAMPTVSNATPVRLATKDNFKLPPLVFPKWKPNEKAYLMAKRRQLESFGHLQRSPRPQTSCRITLASKNHGKNIRMCYDGRPINKGVVAPGRHYSNMVDMVAKASTSHKYKSCFDLPCAYNLVPVHKDSRYLLGVTLPDDDGQPQLYEFTSLPFGLNASPAEMLKWLDSCFQDLPLDMRKRLAYYVDDIVISSATFEEHVSDIEAFFAMCEKHNIKLHPKKSKLLTGSSLEFLGHTCTRGGSTLSARNVVAIQEIPECGNVSDVRHAIGVFSTARRHVPHFAGIAEPMTKLLSKSAKWEWGQNQRQAFRKLKTELANMVTLHQFQPQHQLVIHCDASAYAGGCWLASDVPGKGLQTIAFFSMTFNQKQRTRGAYARESYILLWSLQKCAMYMQSSPHETIVYSDAHSLQYVHASTRSELNARFLAKVAELRYRVIHLPGKDNVVADGLSRFRMQSPFEMADAGKMHALKTLLEQLPHDQKAKENVHIYFAGMKKVAYQMAQDWRTATNAMTRGQVSDSTCERKHDLTIVHAEVLQQVDTARKLFNANRAFCALMCIDLVSRIYTNDDGSTNKKLYQQVVASTKRCMVASNHIWLCHRVGIADSVTLATMVEDGGQDNAMTQPKVIISNDEPGQWDNGTFSEMPYGQTTRDIQQLAAGIKVEEWGAQLDLDEFTTAQRSNMFRDEHDVWRYRTDTKELPLVVPKAHRATIVAITHMGMNHAHKTIVTSEIRRVYWWPSLSKTVAQHDKSCVSCALTRTKIAKIHGLYKASQYFLPRCDWGIDVKRVQIQGGKQQHVLAAIDKFSGYVVLMKLKRRDTAAVVEALTQNINNKTGPPTSLTSDHAREFVSNSFLKWCADNGTYFRTPAQHYAQQNAHVESWWRVLESGLRKLDDFKAWEAEAQQIVFQYNCRAHSTTKMPPFLLFYGGPPNTIAGNKAVQHMKPKDGTHAPSQRQLIQLMGDAAEAARAQAAANGNARRRQVAIQLNNQATSNLEPLEVGTKVLFHQPPSGASQHTSDKRPRTFGTSWIPGTVTDANKMIYTICNATGTVFFRHRSMIKPWPGTDTEFETRAATAKATARRVRQQAVEKAIATRRKNKARTRTAQPQPPKRGPTGDVAAATSNTRTEAPAPPKRRRKTRTQAGATLAQKTATEQNVARTTTRRRSARTRKQRKHIDL